MFTQEIQQGAKITKKAKRLGRGIGSGKGGKAARGQKGQKSRTGSSIMAVFEGGQTPFIQKIPKLKGFTPIAKITYQALDYSKIEAKFDDGATIMLADLIAKGLFRGGRHKVKILSTGKITKKFQVEAHAVSHSAQQKIEKAGGKVTIVA